MAYTYTETHLVLAGFTMHRRLSHINGLSINCTLLIRSYN